MAYKKDTTELSGILLECPGSQDPMLHMLEWLCEQLMEDVPACTEGKKRWLHPLLHHGKKQVNVIR